MRATRLKVLIMFVFMTLIILRPEHTHCGGSHYELFSVTFSLHVLYRCLSLLHVLKYRMCYLGPKMGQRCSDS